VLQYADDTAGVLRDEECLGTLLELIVYDNCKVIAWRNKSLVQSERFVVFFKYKSISRQFSQCVLLKDEHMYLFIKKEWLNFDNIEHEENEFKLS